MTDRPNLDQEDLEYIERVVTNLKVGQLKRHIFLCSDQTKPKCCAREEGLASWDFLKSRLRELGLDTSGHVFRTKAN